MKFKSFIIFICASMFVQLPSFCLKLQDRAGLVIEQQQFFLIRPFYEKLHNQPWFSGILEYPVYKVLGDLLPNGTISQSTALAFLAIDQNNPPLIFSDLLLQWVENAYLLTRNRHLLILNTIIVENMEFLAGV